MRCGLSSVVQLRLGKLTEADALLKRALAITEAAMAPVGLQNSATILDLRFCAARSYSLRRPPRRGLRLIRFWER
jgi:hypothetical protein